MKNINCCKNRDSRKLVVDIAEKIGCKIIDFTTTSIEQKNEGFYIRAEKMIGTIGNKLMTHFIENENKLELFDTKLFIFQILKNDNLNFHFEVELC